MNAPDSPTTFRSVLKDLFWITLFLGILYFGFSWLRPLSNPDEGRYVEIPREMVASGDYVTPRLNGLLYLYKPPLFYWLQAGVVKLAGLQDYVGDGAERADAPEAFKVTPFYVGVVRFVNSALALLSCWIAYLTALALWNRRAGVFAALVLGTSGLWFGLGQVVTMDMTVATFITAACALFLVAVKSPEKSRKRMWCAYGMYVSMALAVLSKGLIGIVLPGGIFFFWLLCFNQWRQLKTLRLFSGILLALAIALPWHVLAALATPETSFENFLSPDMKGRGFLWYYFIYEHFLRFTDAGTAHRAQPWWFFFVCLPLGMLPWLVFLPQSFVHAFKGGWQRARAHNEFGYCLIWTLIPLFFFSASASKLIPYILPSMPPLALLIAYWLSDAWGDPQRYRLNRGIGILGWFALVGAIGVPIALFVRWDRTDWDAVPWYLTLMAVVALSGIAILYFWSRNKPRGGLYALFGGMAALLAVFSPLGTYVQRENSLEIGQWFAPQVEKDDLIFVYDYGQLHDFPLHLKRYVGVADWPNPNEPYGLNVPKEHQFGFVAEYEKEAPAYVGGQVKDRYISMQKLQEHLSSERPTFVLLGIDKFGHIYDAYHFPMKDWRLIRRGKQFVLLGNPPAVRALETRNRAPLSHD